jgi:hypothetical protein
MSTTSATDHYVEDEADRRMALCVGYAGPSARAEVERLIDECERAAVRVVRTRYAGEVEHAEANARYAVLLKARAEALDRMSGREK